MGDLNLTWALQKKKKKKNRVLPSSSHNLFTYYFAFVITFIIFIMKLTLNLRNSCFDPSKNAICRLIELEAVGAIFWWMSLHTLRTNEKNYSPNRIQRWFWKLIRFSLSRARSTNFMQCYKTKWTVSKSQGFQINHPSINKQNKNKDKTLFFTITIWSLYKSSNWNTNCISTILIYIDFFL